MAILGIGYCAADILLHVEGGLTPDRKIEADAMSLQGGGPVGSAVSALSRWGVPSWFAGSIGDDLIGKFIVETFGSLGVNASALKTTPGSSSPLSVCVSHGGGLRTILFSKGSAPRLSAGDLAGLDLRRFEAVEIDGHQSEAQVWAARECGSIGVPVVLDAGSFREEILPLLDLSDHIVASKDFADAFDPSKDYEAFCRKLRRGRVKAVVVTLGAEGSLGFDGSETVIRPALDVRVVDTVGAGDVYHAGYIYSLLQGRGLRERMGFATVCAGLKCRGMGGRASVPSLDEALSACESL